MTHVDEGRLQALLDGELTGEDLHQLEEHLSECLPCRRDLEELRKASNLFADVIPTVDRQGVVSRGFAVGFPRRPSAWRRAASAVPRAAVLVLAFAAAAAALVPGSPVYRWLESLGPQEEVVELEPSPVQPAPTAVAEEAEPEIEAGVSVDPLDEVVEVVLTGAGTDLRVRAIVTDGSRAGVFATGPAAQARFETAPGRIEVIGASGGELRIELPRAAREAEVSVNGAEYLRKEGTHLRLVASEEAGTAEVFFRVRN